MDCEKDPGGVAYGLEFRGAQLDGELLPLAEHRFPVVSISQESGSLPAGHAFVDEDEARVDLRDGQRAITMHRARACAVYRGPRVPDDELVHPYLAPIATVFARWLGREAFHAGALVIEGGAWALLGTNFAGKSTLLAAHAASGGDVLADDVVVVDGERALAGPRCIDLRHRLPPELDAQLLLRQARSGSRWRVALPEIGHSVPLHGWVFLSWGSESELTPLTPADCLGRLAVCRAWRQLPSDPTVMLRLAGLPAVSLVRPRERDKLSSASDQLARALAELRAGQASR